MKHQAAYSLLWLSGKEPSKRDVENFMKKCGVSVDHESLDIFFEKMQGVNMVDAVAEGSKKLFTMPAVSGVAVAGPFDEQVAAEPEPVKKDEEEPIAITGLFDEEDY